MPSTARLLLLAALLLGADALAADRRQGDIEIGQAWARPTAGAARTGAAYFIVTNHGEAADRLLGAATPVARQAELHGQQMEEGIVRMRPVSAIEVHPGEPAVLGPGGLHVMLIGLAAPLREGERFPLALIFERAGRIDIEVPVQRPAGREPGHGGSHGRHGS